MRILLTGGSGLLGSNIQQCAALTRHELFAPTHREMDITDARAVADYMEHMKVDTVLHCAAYSKVDRAESEEGLCRLINVTGTDYLVNAAKRIGAYLLYISSDYVFDGEKNEPYEISDRKKPLSVYGCSKADGEEIVLREVNNCVLRTSWLFGSYGTCFPDSILRLSRQRETIPVVCDQIGSPTYVKDLAELLITLCEKRVSGIVHATDEGECSWSEFAKAILESVGSHCTVKPILSAQYPAAAKRPKNSRLSKSSLDAAGLKRLPYWGEGLADFLNERNKYIGR